MWQKVQTNTANQGANQEKSKNNLTQVLKWKYGVIFISDYEQLTDVKDGLKDSQLLITTQPFIREIQGTKNRARTIYVESNQENKSLQTMDWLCGKMVQRGVNRNTTIFIKGGGLLLDMCGFAASIFMRGVQKVVFIPTSLLAIVDATVGGKNGVNWGGAKNMLGVIRHPEQIRISLHYLQTLSQRQFSNGMTEVIKMAMTHDAQLFQMLQKQQVTLARLRKDKQLQRQITKRSLQIKIKVVQNDQFDKDQRQWLNFGHTVGHGLQLSQVGRNLKHGQCIAIGILHQIKIGEEIGEITDKTIYDRVQRVFKKFNIPTRFPEDTNIDQVIQLMNKDKKVVSKDHVELTLIDKIGQRKKNRVSLPIQKLTQYFRKNLTISIADKNKFKQSINNANKKWKTESKFPASKSLSIRYIFLSALHFLKHRKPVIIHNFSQCDDTKLIKQCLRALGFTISENIKNKSIQIKDYQQHSKGKLYVGNSGLTARFMLPLCSHLGGQWVLQCQKRMTQRPNEQIFNFCKQHYDVEFDWLENIQNCFPVRVKSKGLKAQSLKKPIVMKSQESSQFVSSVLTNSYLWKGEKQVEIKLPAGKVVSQSYVLMTIGCLQKFGSQVKYNKKNGQNTIYINNANTNAKPVSNITVEQDLSSYSYPFALSLIHGSQLPETPIRSAQGDLQFYRYCQLLQQGKLDAQLDFAECTDTFMTMAAILATNHKNRFNIKHKQIQIFGIGNQKFKQSNRLQLIRLNFNRIGFKVQEFQDGLIFPGTTQYKQFKDGQIVAFETAGDHRLAMSLALLSTYLSTLYPNVKFAIDDKQAVIKTFPEFWSYLSDSGVNLGHNLCDSEVTKAKSGYKTQQSAKPDPKIPPKKASANPMKKTIIAGNRGSGKTSLARMICKKTGDHLVDLDLQITKAIETQEHNPSPSNKPIKSISDFVEVFGWDQFRKVESLMLQKALKSTEYEPNTNKPKNMVIALGGGIVDWAQSLQTLKNLTSIPKFYIQKQFKDLKIQKTDHRPEIPNFQQAVKVRSKKYENIADYIITIPGSAHTKHVDTGNAEYDKKMNRDQYQYAKINQYVFNQYNNVATNLRRIPTENNTLHDGYIYIVPQIYNNSAQISKNDKALNWIQQQEQFTKFTRTSQDDQEHEQQSIAGVELRIDMMLKQQIQMYPQLKQLVKNNVYSQEVQQQLIRRIRYAIAQFKLNNRYIVNKLPLILTLRTLQQYGKYPSHFQTNSIDILVPYYKWIRALHKIPASYIDYQFKYHMKSFSDPNNSVLRLNPTLNQKRYIYSYHGKSVNAIHQFLNYYNAYRYRNDVVKLCFNGAQHIWQRNFEHWNKFSQICVNLRNPLTRLENKFKMVRRAADNSRLMDIPTRPELTMMKQLKRFFR